MTYLFFYLAGVLVNAIVALLIWRVAEEYQTSRPLFYTAVIISILGSWATWVYCIFDIAINDVRERKDERKK